jgi:hypothetical protein
LKPIRSPQTRERERKYYLANREKKLQYQKAWAANNKDRTAVHKIKYNYGLTEEAYSLLIIQQDYKCKICNKEEKLHIDHDHNTNKIRGLLCGKCNKALGLFQDDPANLDKAAAYLRETC